MKCKDMKHITWLTGMPRSGTSWFAQIFASSPAVRLKLCPLFSYEFKNALDESSTSEDWISFFEKVYVTQSEYLDQVFLRREGIVPNFSDKDVSPEHLVIKSTRFHNLIRSILEKHPFIRFVALVRNPCAAIHSWLTNPMEFPEGEESVAQWRSGECRKTGPGEFWGFDDWKYVTSLHLALASEYPERFKIIRYEDLVRNAEETVKGLFFHLGIPYTDQTEYFLRQSQSTHNTHTRAVFKSPDVKDRWRKEMDPCMAREIIEELQGTPLAQFVEE